MSAIETNFSDRQLHQKYLFGVPILAVETRITTRFYVL
jgi:hypothetical protein